MDSTLSGNSSEIGGGIINYGLLALVSSTITENTSTVVDAGGVSCNQTTGAATLTNDIIAGNGAPSAPDLYRFNSAVINAAYCLIGNTAGSGITGGTGNILNPSSTGLGTLGNNGGPTQTIPLSGGPALGAGGAETTISAAAADAVTTTITVANTSLFAASALPTLSTGSYFTIQIDGEQMAVIGVSSSSLTVVRGVNGTTAAAHASGASVYLVSDQRGYFVPANSPPVVDMGAYQTTGDHPWIAAVSPNAGATNGGTIVTITGSNFTGTTAVFFGSAPATSFTVNSNTQITAVDPVEAIGAVDITVTTPLELGSIHHDQFTYVPTVTANTANLADNAVSLTINGSGFDTNPANDSVTFGNGVVGTVTAATSTQLTVTISTPPTALGSLTAVVTADGQSSGTAVQVATLVNGNWLVTDSSSAAGSLTDVTLPYAVAHAVSGDQIAFAAGLSGDTISLSSPLTINSNVTIIGPATGTVTLEGTITVASGTTLNEQGNLTLGASGTLTVDGVANIYGTVEISSGGSFNDLGTVNVEVGGTLSDQDSITVVSGAVLNEYGNLDRRSGGVLTVQSGGVLNVYGSVTIESGGSLIIDAGGILNIYGSVTIDSGATYSPLGTVTIEPGGHLYPPVAVTSVTVNGDLLNVTSSITAAVENAGSTSVQITTSSADGFYVGELVQISNVGTAEFNGTYAVASVIDATDFTYTDANFDTNSPGSISNGGTAVNALGGVQRSMVDSVVYQFNQAVTLAPAPSRWT